MSREFSIAKLVASTTLRAMDVSPEDSILTCSFCGGAIDGTGLEIGSVIACPHCTNEFPVTQKFGNYLLEKKLGSGGMGAVYQAVDLMLHRSVAIKVLKTELTNDTKFLETFKREAQITASLNHPNIVQVFASGEVNGTYYLVMECITNGSLDDRIMDFGRVTELEGLEVGIAVASGLMAAQEYGLVHRDIKPGNILFGANLTPKVVDFGLALDSTTVDHFAGEIWGTPYYLPPEKLEGYPEDHRSDIYSLGATLFHAISGRPPYEHTDPREVAMMHLKGLAVNLKTFVPEVNSQTSHAIAKAMARYPHDRFQSYPDLIAQLEDAKRRLLSQDPSQKEVSSVEIVSDQATDKTSAWAMGAVVALILILLGVLFFFKDQIFSGKKAAPSELQDYDPTAPNRPKKK
jgi:serine/threonine protein kinase